MTDYGLVVKETRQKLGLTQKQFAERLGVTLLTVHRWENNHTKPSPMAVKLIKSLPEYPT